MSNRHPNSMLSLSELKGQGKLSKRAAAILQWLMAHPHPYTDREIAIRMAYPDMNCVRPRVTEMLQDGLLVEVDQVVCPITKKRVRRVAPALRQGEFQL